MGVTAGGYAKEPQKAPKENPEPYREEGSDDLLVDRTSFAGTVDTSGVGPGSYEDLRNVTRTFDRADESLARRVETAEDIESVERDTGVPVEGADPEATPAEVADALRNRGQEKAEGETHPVLGDPETVRRQVDADEAERKRLEDEANGTGSTGDGDEDLVENPGEGTQAEVEEAVGDDPEKAQAALEAEQADRDRTGLTESLEKTIEDSRKEAVDESFDPAEKDVKEIKEYFSKVTDDEILRVQGLEEKRKPEPRKTVMNWTRD